MNIATTKKIQIRNYLESDAGKIGEFDRILELSYRYNSDFIPANIFCAVNMEGEIQGVGHLEPHDTWNLIDKDNVTSGFIHKLKVNISINSQFSYPDTLKEDLLKRLLGRAKEIRKQYPEKNIRVFTWLSSDENDEIDFYLSEGFVAYQNSLVLKYDLTKAIPNAPQPEGINVINHKMEMEEELIQYHEAESIAFSGAVWSLNYVRWLKCGPEWANFSAFYKNKLVGNTMTWKITEERSATEDVLDLL